MEVIKILFFALGTFFGVENSTIIAEKTTVTINTESKTITVQQHDLFTLVRNKQDSTKASQELYRIGNYAAGEDRYKFRSEFDIYAFKESNIIYHKEEQRLDATITLRYNTPADLKDFAIDFVQEDGSYAIINIPSWNIATTTGELRGNYWYFKDEISFTLSPAKDMPQQYLQYKQGLYPYWIKVKP